MPDSQLRRLADDYWEAHIAENPSLASLLGDRRFDDQIEDISDEREAARRATYVGFAEKLAAIEPGALDQADRVTHQLLAEEIRTNVSLIDARWWDMAWDQMTGAHTELLIDAPQMNAPTPESAHALVERWRKIPTYLDQAIERHRHALATGRTAPDVVLERSLNLLDKYLTSPVDDDSFVTFPGPPEWDGEAAWREELTTATRDHIRPAMTRYREFLASEVRGSVRPNDRCGLRWIEGGDEYYRTMIRWWVGLDVDPAEVHEIGMAELRQKLPAEYAEVGGRLFGRTDTSGVFDRLRTDPSLSYADGQQMLDDAQAVLDAAKAVMGDWFGRLPKTDCELKPVPEHLAADVPAAYYFPPAADGSRPGTYFVNTHDPEHRHPYDTASTACHEAIPGHHFQLAIGTELEDLPTFQRLSQGHNAFVEGWGLYSERLGDEMGLYGTDLDRLGMLAADSFRSCRLVVDTGIHALGWSREQAIEFMTEHTPVPREEVAVEVDRYIAMPGQALTYKLGQLEIFRLRRQAEARLGDGFDIRGFHDTVLGSSSISLPVLARLVDDWVASLDGGARP
ncbi:MAG: DUF885 domain-containing protein [Acidimicrobiales bacterium]